MEYQLGIALSEEGKQNRGCPLFQYVVKESGNIEQQLAHENAEHEMKVEEMVYMPLQEVLEQEFPNVLKHKHALRKYCLDKDSASNRYNATKKETVKEDLEEADNKVEQTRDLLAIEMFNILARENEFSEYVLQLLKLQRGYHESALKNLETIIPQLEKKIGNSPVRKVFGTTLKEHLRITGKKIAYPLEICISALSDYGILEEGLFRVAGSSAKIKRLKCSIDSGCFSFLIPEYRDAHVLASLLKLYLRQLPEPLLTFYLHKEWINAMQYQGTQRSDTIKNIIEKLPQENKDNLSYLMQFLSKLSQHPENKMSASNIAIVLSPNLLWCKEDEDSANMGNCVLINMLIEYLIKEADAFFPDDVSKYVTVTRLFHDEDIGRYNRINDIIKPDSPKPNTRKKKFAPVPPNPPSKLDQDVSKNLDITKYNKNMENLNINTPNTVNLVKQNSSENVTASSTQKQQNDHSTHAIHQQVVTDDPQVQKSERKEVVVKPNALLDSSHELKTPSKQVAHSQPHVENKCSTITISTHKITDSSDTQLRQKDRPSKPEVPARPLSLTKRTSDNTDSAFKKTHCSLYNVADKMQPSIINIKKDNETNVTRPDFLSVEKMGSVPKTEGDASFVNKINVSPTCNLITSITINRNEATSNVKTGGDISNKTKSNEQINCIDNINTSNICDRKNSHIRAKSDGGIMDFEGEQSYAKVSPTSPKCLSKPTHPPPPPPGV